MYIIRRLLSPAKDAAVPRRFQYFRLGEFSTIRVENATVFGATSTAKRIQEDLKNYNRYNSENWEIVELERATKEELQIRNHEARLKESGNRCYGFTNT